MGEGEWGEEGSKGGGGVEGESASKVCGGE